MQFFGAALAVSLGILTAAAIALFLLGLLVQKTSLGYKSVNDPAERARYITASINAAILSKRTGNALAARMNAADYDPAKDPVPMSYEDLARFMNTYFGAYRVNIHVNTEQAEMLLHEYMAPRSPFLETFDPRTR